MLDHPPLLPAPPAFEAAFSPYENMFHTVFYRRYPYERLNDAKQDALDSPVEALEARHDVARTVGSLCGAGGDLGRITPPED